MSTVLSKVKGFSKKKKVLLILSTVLFVLFTIAGGYLLWRVSQPETIAPEDSEAYMYYDSVSCNEAGCWWRYDLNICTGSGGCVTRSGNCASCYQDEFCYSGNWNGAALCCHECPNPPPPNPPNPCAGDDVNDKAIKDLDTYNIKNGKLPSKVGPFPKGAKVILYYKSLLGSGVRPKVTFTYGGKDYSVKMPVLDSNKRAKVTITNFTISNENDYVYLKYSYDDYDQGNPECNPGDEKYKSFGWMDVKDNKCGTTLKGPPKDYIPFVPVSVASDIKWAKDDGATIVSKQCWADWREWKGDYDFDDYFLQIGYIEEKSDPVCGTNADLYPAEVVAWPSEDKVAFCKEGNPSPGNPIFPIPGATTEWDCIENGVTITCRAGREFLDPVCGTFTDQEYEASDEEWPSVIPEDAFCKVGTPSPAFPTFPASGSSSSWICMTDSGESPLCVVSRLPYPVCGTNESEYQATDTAWPKDGTFCEEGEATPSRPKFPSAGSNTTWSCKVGTTSVDCLATRLNLDPVCGTYGGVVYQTTDTTWPPGGTFCSIGSPEPLNPLFPSVGSSTVWTCNSGSGSVSCLASRQKNEEAPTVVLPPAEPLVIPPRATLVVPPVPEKIPETGVFDDIERPVLIGGILVFLGITWSWIGRGMYITINFLGEVYRKTVLSIKDMKESIRLRKRSTLMKKDVERKKKFERKVSRKI